MGAEDEHGLWQATRPGDHRDRNSETIGRVTRRFQLWLDPHDNDLLASPLDTDLLPTNHLCLYTNLTIGALLKHTMGRIGGADG
jgi:hypothetical protein